MAEKIIFWAVIALGGLYVSNIWMRLFLWLCVISTIIHPHPSGFITLVWVAIFMTLIEFVRHVKIPSTIILGIIALSACIAIISLHLNPTGPSTESGYLALSMSAFLFGSIWWPASIFIFCDLIEMGTTTSLIAATAGIVFWLAITSRFKILIFVLFGLYVGITVIGYRLSVIGYQPSSSSLYARLIAWRETVSICLDSPRNFVFGHGLGRFKEIFPERVCGILELRREGLWMRAHNEYLQGFFELGIGFFMVVGGYFVSQFRRLKYLNLPEFRMIMTAFVVLAVGCAGFHYMHLAPTALLAATYMGLLERYN